jgi:hypothetical protein
MVPTRILITLLALAATPALAGEPELFQASATFVPASASSAPLIRVVLTATDADVKVKGRPTPRLRLSSTQRSLTLLDPQGEVQAVPGPHYVDLAQPLRFPATLSGDAPKAPHAVEATLSFVYCSTSKGWCRKGNARVEIPVDIR